MLSKKLLTMGTLSTLLMGTTLFAGERNCANGVCFATLDKHLRVKVSKQMQKKIIPFIKKNEFDKSITIVLDGETITVFPKSTYVMSEEEKINYFENEEANKDLLMITQIVEKTEDKILEKTDLPTSEYYCEKNTKPLYHKVSDSFECV